MNILEKMKLVTLRPSEFFDKVKGEKGLTEAFKFLAVVSMINVIGVAASSYLMSSLFYSITSSPLYASQTVSFVWYIAAYLIGLPASFLGAGAIHMFSLIFKSKGTYSDTYKAVIYGGAPHYIFGWIPLAGVIFYLYSIYTTIRGISKLHGVTMSKAALIVLAIPLILLTILFIIMGAFVFFLFSGF